MPPYVPYLTTGLLSGFPAKFYVHSSRSPVLYNPPISFLNSSPNIIRRIEQIMKLPCNFLHSSVTSPILEREDGVIWTGLFWLKIGTSGRPL
jgi:hypothetical protein